jgi:hypothetical protein
MRSTYDGQTFSLDGRELNDPDSPGGQAALANAHQQHVRPSCRCRPNGVEMYVARIASGWYILKRLPHSGSQHDPGCPSFELPTSLTGRTTFVGTAIIDDGEAETDLRLGVSLRRPLTHDRTARDPGVPDRRSRPNEPRLGLRGLLHYLWDEAGFSRWSPRMAGKRTWPVVSWHLRQVGERTTIGGAPLSETLWIPESFRADHKVDIAARRKDAWAHIGGERSRQDLMILVGELKAIRDHDRGRVFIFRHMPDSPVMIDTAVYDNFTQAYGEELSLWEAEPDDHLLIAATFSVTKDGLPVIEEPAAMITSSEWLPYFTVRGRKVLTAAVDSQRRFIIPLPYGPTDHSAQPVLVLTDTPEPVAAITDTAAPPDIDSWIWPAAGPMPALPPAAPRMTSTGDNPQTNRTPSSVHRSASVPSARPQTQRSI